ncbi:MAG: aminotransferase class I/II-fold pyridoxal phosphate-dependent enzyme [Pseudomonadales bacterium]|nr:aminotransferase class I/II-fold pyridoxal phosphate-dependent enzyme [Pseudomonadales bacterium]
MSDLDDENARLPVHGGDILTASKRYGIDVSDWIDLSTGINPEPYSAYNVPRSSYEQLPYPLPGFQAAVSEYYQSSEHLAIAGSQTAIQALPRCLKSLPVLLPLLGYQEHLKFWQRENSDTHFYPSLDKQSAVESIDTALNKNNQQHLVIINPNNPTGLIFDADQLRCWAQQLAYDAYLIVDEAFMDLTPEQSLLTQDLPHNVIVLRSFGKFFGLAGIRLGFIFANKPLLDKIENDIGIWQVNGPAQHIAITALQDDSWQIEARTQLANNARTTEAIINPVFHHDEITPLLPTPLFSSYLMPRQQAFNISEHFAKSGILFRIIPYTETEALLRVGVLSDSNTLAIKRLKETVKRYD